jgi:hypothetical protein
MSLSTEAVRQVEQGLRTRAEVLAYEIGNLVPIDPERARAISAEIIALLNEAVSQSDPPVKSELFSLEARRTPRSGGRDEIEEFVLDIFAHSPRGLSVQDIVERLQEAEIEIKRATLVVRLHRMVQAGKLTSRTHGHYVLSEAEHNRRQSA